MLETKEREYKARDGNAVAFSVTYLPAKRGFTLLADLAKMFGPALGILVDSAGGLEAKASLAALVGQKTQGNLFERAARAVFEHMDTEKVQGLIAQLADVTRVKYAGTNGNWVELPKIYDLLFQGQTLLQLRWLAYALEVQYGDFLSLRDALGQRESSAGASGLPG